MLRSKNAVDRRSPSPPVRRQRKTCGYALERFSADGWQPVDQGVHGHDFWQVGFDAGTRKFRMTFNVPLDNHGSTTTHRFRLRPDISQAQP